MTIFVRPVREEDSEKFAKWFLNSDGFHPNIFQFPETYTLCAFKKSEIVAFLVVEYGPEAQLLSRLVVNPEASDLEKALAHRELLKQVIAIGYLQNIPKIYFVGNVEGTNRLASHIFKQTNPSEQPLFKTDFPVYCLTLRELE